MSQVSEKVTAIEAIIRDTIEGRRPIDGEQMRDATGALVLANMISGAAQSLADEQLRRQADDMIAPSLMPSSRRSPHRPDRAKRGRIDRCKIVRPPIGIPHEDRSKLPEGQPRFLGKTSGKP